MTPAETFLWGFGGSLVAELITVLPIYYHKPIVVPERFRRIDFWFARALLAVVAGGLALGYHIQSEILAANIGASAPSILNLFAQGVRPPTPPTAEEIAAPR